MKKAKPSSSGGLREEYSREDFGRMSRGKYAARLKASSNVVVLTPAVAKAFPNSEAVNDALMGLLTVAKAAASQSRRAAKPARKRAAR